MSKTFRIPKVSRSKAQSFTRAVALKVFEDINTPRSLACYILLKNKEYSQLVELEVLPQNYKDAYGFSLDYQATNLLKKADFLPLDIDRSAVALEKFLKAEEKCKETNDRFFNKTYCTEGSKDLQWSRYLFVAANKISKILGKLPDLSTLDYRFGPGASSTCKGKDTTLGDKFQSHISSTHQAATIWLEASKTLPHLVAAAYGIDNIDGPYSATGGLALERGNKLMFVPKSAKTDRAICVEPHTNILLQKGVGSYIRQRLALFGLDLTRQADKNALFARQGSIDGSYATIDLSSASDTISYAIVLELLPMEWFNLLDSLRSPETLLPDGTWLVNEKFSSMGNGFTFELETLIFFSLISAIKEVDCIDGEVMTFGDDIIVPTVMAETSIDFLEFCGFSTNVEKTYLSGPFRESCGKDYFNGVNVRPYQIKELIQYETDKFKIANGIHHFSCRLHSHLHDYADSRLYGSWTFVLRNIPEDLRLFGPAYLGDSTIWASRRDALEYRPQGLRSRVQFLSVLPRAKRLSSFGQAVQRAVSLYGSSENLPYRGFSGLARIKSGPISLWGWEDGSWL